MISIIILKRWLSYMFVVASPWDSRSSRRHPKKEIQHHCPIHRYATKKQQHFIPHVTTEITIRQMQIHHDLGLCKSLPIPEQRQGGQDVRSVTVPFFP